MKRFALAGLAIAGMITSAQAGTLEDVAKRGSIRLGYSETSVPFSFKNKDGEIVGYSVELCKRVAAGIARATKTPELKIEWVPLTPADRIDAVVSGKADIECGTTTTTIGRREKVEFSLPIFVDASTVLARSAAARTMAELQGKKVAVADNTTTLSALQRALARRFVNAEVVKTKTVAEGFELLKAGKVDALAGDRTALVGTFLAGGGAEGLTVFGEDLSLEPYGLVLRRDVEFKLAVDRVLASIYRTGEIEAVYAAWLEPLGKPGIPLMTMYLLNALPE